MSSSVSTALKVANKLLFLYSLNVIFPSSFLFIIKKILIITVSAIFLIKKKNNKIPKKRKRKKKPYLS